ncbi:hypothetical protein [Amphritea sp. HPY]|uniref:hypothetical protein n=1 Tax=Amphritea sp. HPY TaxID=3421652 RepID=UPI003D7D67AD
MATATDTGGTAIIANMNPDQEYTASLLAEVCGVSANKVAMVLREASLGGVVQRFEKPGVNGFVYRTNQLTLELKRA